MLLANQSINWLMRFFLLFFHFSAQTRNRCQTFTHSAVKWKRTKKKWKGEKGRKRKEKEKKYLLNCRQLDCTMQMTIIDDAAVAVANFENGQRCFLRSTSVLNMSWCWPLKPHDVVIALLSFSVTVITVFDHCCHCCWRISTSSSSDSIASGLFFSLGRKMVISSVKSEHQWQCPASAMPVLIAQSLGGHMGNS